MYALILLSDILLFFRFLHKISMVSVPPPIAKGRAMQDLYLCVMVLSFCRQGGGDRGVLRGHSATFSRICHGKVMMGWDRLEVSWSKTVTTYYYTTTLKIDHFLMEQPQVK